MEPTWSFHGGFGSLIVFFLALSGAHVAADDEDHLDGSQDEEGWTFHGGVWLLWYRGLLTLFFLYVLKDLHNEWILSVFKHCKDYKEVNSYKCSE